jgi:hypothetical protein
MLTLPAVMQSQVLAPLTAHYTAAQIQLLSTQGTPYGIVVDGTRNLYIASNGGILKETLWGGNYTQSVVPSVGLLFPEGVGVDGSGDVFIANSELNQVVEVTTGPVDVGLVNVNGGSGIISLIFTFDTAGTLGSFATFGPNFGSSGLRRGPARQIRQRLLGRAAA